MKRLLALVTGPYRLDALAGTYTCAYLVWLALRTPGTHTTELVSDAMFFPLGLVVAWVCWRNIAGAPDRRTKAAWLCFGASALTLWASGNIWSAYLWMMGPTESPVWLDWIEPLQVVWSIAAYLILPGRPLEQRSRRRYALDTTLVVVAGFSVALHFALWSMPNQVGTRLTYTYSMLLVDWAMFVLCSVAIIQKRDASIRRMAVIQLVALTTGMVGNFVLSLSTEYHAGDAVDVLWFLSWSAKWSSARLVWHRHRLGLDARDTVDDPARAAYQGSVLAYGLVAVAFTIFMLQLFYGDPVFVRLLGYATLVMVVVLFARQVVALDENRRLFTEQLAQEGRFRSLVQNASDLTVMTDRDGVITYVSPSGARIFGAVPSLQLGFPVSVLFPAQDSARLVPADEHSPIPTREMRTRIQTATGEWREVEVVATDLRNTPTVAAIVYNCRDVTDRVAIEQTLLHAQKLDAIGRLAGGLAHDLNNVLTVIRGYAELLRDGIGEDANASADLRHIENAVDKAAGVTKKLLGLSRNTAVQHTSVDVNAVIRGLEPILKQVLTDRIEIVIECEPVLGQIWADPGQMEQVLINLVTNARDAMPKGGTVRITTSNVDIDGALAASVSAAPGAYVAIAVHDQGVGVTDELRARIFEPFFSTKPPDRGMGLGLAMVRNIVDESKGSVVLESEPGQGSTFTILLPRIQDAAAPAAEVDAPNEAVDMAGFTVLVVDDEIPIRAVAGRILQRHGCRVIEATSGVTALAMAESVDWKIDAVLTDLVMPQMDGRELIARVRELRPNLPVVCMSGFADPSDGTAGLGPSVLALVTKPFSSHTLVRAVASALVGRDQTPA